MLKPLLVCAVIAVSAGAAYAVNPPNTDSNTSILLHSTLNPLAGQVTEMPDPVADVRPGETFTITGACVQQGDTSEAVRVVLTLADGRGSDDPGYRSVLATDQEIHGNSLEVRVPDLPESANRVFLVKLFRLGQPAPEICNAGSIHIGGQTGGKVG
jgi:hypothetical protein